jgi:hypothetical protein
MTMVRLGGGGGVIRRHLSLVRSYSARHGWQNFLIVVVTHVLSRIIKFTHTGSNTQSVYYPQIIHF